MKQGLGALQLFMMGFGAIVGVGWIVVVGEWVAQAGPGGSVIALAGGAAFMMVVGRSYDILAQQGRLTGDGEIGAVGDSMGRQAAFAVTAALLLAYMSIVAFVAVSAGWILVTLIPALEGPVVYSVLGWNVHLGPLLIAGLGTCVVAALNMRSIMRAAHFQYLVVYAMIAVTLAFCIAGLMRGEPAHLLPLVPQPMAATSVLAGILAMMATMPLWYAGFNVVLQLTAERDSKVSLSTVARVMYCSIAAACLFYVSVVLSAAYVVPWSSLVAAPLPVATAFRVAFDNRWVSDLVLIAGFLGIASTWNACFAAGTRVLRRLLVQLRSAAGDQGAGHRDDGPPGREVVISVALISGLASLAGRAALLPIINVGAVCFGFVYFCVSIAAWRASARPADRRLAVLSAIVSAFMSVYVINSAVRAEGWAAPEVLVAFSWLLLAAASWKLFQAKRRAGTA